MYCKELLFSGATEFCFEELRAERYYKKMAQEVRGQASTSASNWCIEEDWRFESSLWIFTFI